MLFLAVKQRAQNAVLLEIHTILGMINCAMLHHSIKEIKKKKKKVSRIQVL